MSQIDEIARRLEHAAESIYNYSPDFSQAAADFLHGDAVWLVERVRTLEKELADYEEDRF